MSVSEPPVRLSLHSLEDFVGLVPYLVGFHPADSLVVVVMQEGQLCVTARVDLADVRRPGNPARLLDRVFGRFPGAVGWCFAYSGDEQLAWEVLDDCAAALGRRLSRAVHVGDGFWRADGADEPTVPIAGEVPAVAAQATALGMPARASRKELAECVVGPADAEVGDLVRLFAQAEDEMAVRSRSSRRRLLRTLLRSEALGREDAVRLAVLVADGEGVAEVLRRLDRSVAHQQLALWTAVVRHSLLVYQANPLGLLGMAAWQTGDGALQVICLERLEWIEPDCLLAALLDVLNQQVVPPQEWPSVRRHFV